MGRVGDLYVDFVGCVSDVSGLVFFSPDVITLLTKLQVSGPSRRSPGKRLSTLKSSSTPSWISLRSPFLDSGSWAASVPSPRPILTSEATGRRVRPPRVGFALEKRTEL